MGANYTKGLTLKSMMRVEAGFVVIENGILRAKRNLSAFHAKCFGCPVSVAQIVEEDDRLPYHYGYCTFEGLLFIACIRRWGRRTHAA